MNRDVSGVNGQFVTTWGSDLKPGTDIIVPGSDHPLTTSVTCRCGSRSTFLGWSVEVEKRTDFRIYFTVGTRWYQHEYFCSQSCWVRFEPEQATKQIDKLNNHIEWSKSRIESIKKDLGI